MKVLLIVIDAATPRVVSPAIQTGRLPTMQRLMNAGQLHQSITMFPSITPAATTTIITGCYPAESGIIGASWYDDDHQNVAYFGDDFWVMVREGFRAFLTDFLVGLNGSRMTAPTLFEKVERAGQTAMCLNYLIFKGAVEHKVHIPKLLALLPGVPLTETIKGPSVLCLGDFVATRTMRGKRLVDKGGVLHRFGMDDASTGKLLLEVAEDGAFADFSVAYFADNDYRSHDIGPTAALPVIERIDAALGKMFDAAGGLETFLKETCVIITSDHGHCEILDDRDRAVIRLHDVLAEFQQAKLGKPWGRGDEIMICPNMRATQVYLRDDADPRLERMVRLCVADPRVDHAMWCEGETSGGGNRFVVESQRGRLAFWRGSQGGDAHAEDAYGRTWSWRGDLVVLNGVVEDGQLRWCDYPNAFERLAGALDAKNAARLWVTARPGCEFEVPGGEAHVGGASHGGLHALESLSLLLIAGPEKLTLPEQFRSVDIAPLCLNLLDIPSSVRVGDPR
ncbi:MAG TPA: alkaline phosphatase family protein [Vicinamibacterales bacterium]|nr:alkaline phosphatase family protein [Vicinamibacterales bacterium]